MATIDDLAAQVNQLQGTVNSLQSTVNGHSTSIHNLETNYNSLAGRVKTNEDNIAQHRKELNQHRIELDDHEKRLKLIEEDEIQYRSILFYKNAYKLPKIDENKNVLLYMPPFTKDELKEHNPDIPGLVEYKWYQKIFNPSHIEGNVTFDFDKSQDYLKSISLGPHSQINIPVPIELVKLRNNRRLIIQSCYMGILLTQQFIEFEKENVITLFNFTNSTINILTGEPLFELMPVYGYDVNKLTNVTI